MINKLTNATLSFAILLCAPAAISGVKTEDNTRVQTYVPVTFEIANQSIWASGSSKAFNVDWYLGQV